MKGAFALPGNLFEGLVLLALSAQASLADSRAPILIPGVEEPAEMRVEPFPTAAPSEPLKMLGALTGNGAKMNDPAIMIPVLDKVLAKYPEFGDGYAVRAGLRCAGSDKAAILSDLNSALKYADSSPLKHR